MMVSMMWIFASFSVLMVLLGGLRSERDDDLSGADGCSTSAAG